MEKLARFLFVIFFYLSLVACDGDPAESLGSTSQEIDNTGLALKMPLPAGYQWGCNTAVNDVGDVYHTDEKNGYYSLDFGRRIMDNDGVIIDTGNREEGGIVDVLAAAAGQILDTAAYPLVTTGCTQYGTTCQVNIKHGDYVTKYLHFKTDTIRVVKDQQVVQGQVLGKMGNTGQSTGAHLHFQVFYKDKSLSTTDELAGITLEGEEIATTYACANPPTLARHFHPSSNHNNDSTLPLPGITPWKGAFDFVLDSNSVYGCTDDVSLTTFTCQNRQTVYQPGQNVNLVVRTDNARKDITFSVEAWRNGQPTFDWTWVDPKLNIAPSIWPHAYYLPRFTNVYAGDWEMRIFADVGSGSFKLATFHFTVLGNQQWPASPYEYNNNSYHCKGGVTGGSATNWIYTCNGQQTSYSQGDNVSAMVRIDNVTSSHQFRARIFKNGSYWYTTNPSGWNDVPTGQTWEHAYYWTTITNAEAALYEVRVDIDLPGGEPFEHFLTAFQFTVNAGPTPPPYTYNGNVVACANEPTGGESTGWIYTCPRPTWLFSQGQNVHLLVYVENVRQSYKFRARFYRDGVYHHEEITSETAVPPGQVWSRAYTWPSMWYVPSGNWRASLDISVAGGSWQQLQSSITFTVLAPIGGYTTSSFKICRGNPEDERTAGGVPQCLHEVSTISSLSASSPYYWRLQFTALYTNIRFRIEAYNNGVYVWGYDFGPYAPVNGQAWFWPQFVNPGPGNWELLFFADIGGGFKQVEADRFSSLP